MKHFIIPLAAILLFASGSFAQAEDSAGRCDVVNEKVAALISQYKALGSSLIPTAHGCNLELVLQQPDEVLDMWSFACATH